MGHAEIFPSLLPLLLPSPAERHLEGYAKKTLAWTDERPTDRP